MGILRVGINGFGRIGRVVFRTCLERSDMEVVAINDPAVDVRYIRYLMKFDSTHGTHRGEIMYKDDEVIVDGKKVKVFHQKAPSSIPWHAVGVEYVVEASGMFTTHEKASGHLQSNSVKRVIVTAPSLDIPMLILGVNEEAITADHKIVSSGSSTLYCMAPIIKVLEEKFVVSDGIVTSIHAMTASLKPLDGICMRGKHWRDYRGIHQNIIPATTGACRALENIIPSVKDKLAGLGFRVPIVNVSVLDITVRLETETTLSEIVNAVQHESETSMQNIIDTSEDDAVSSDFIGDKHSCILDVNSSLQLKPNYYKLVCWYENEHSYACRIADSILFCEKQYLSSIVIKANILKLKKKQMRKEIKSRNNLKVNSLQESTILKLLPFNVGGYTAIKNSNKRLEDGKNDVPKMTNITKGLLEKSCNKTLQTKNVCDTNTCTRPSSGYSSGSTKAEILAIDSRTGPLKPSTKVVTSFYRNLEVDTGSEFNDKLEAYSAYDSDRFSDITTTTKSGSHWNIEMKQRSFESSTVPDLNNCKASRNRNIIRQENTPKRDPPHTTKEFHDDTNKNIIPASSTTEEATHNCVNKNMVNDQVQSVTDESSWPNEFGKIIDEHTDKILDLCHEIKKDSRPSTSRNKKFSSIMKMFEDLSAKMNEKQKVNEKHEALIEDGARKHDTTKPTNIKIKPKQVDEGTTDENIPKGIIVENASGSDVTIDINFIHKKDADSAKRNPLQYKDLSKTDTSVLSTSAPRPVLNESLCPSTLSKYQKKIVDKLDIYDKLDSRSDTDSDTSIGQRKSNVLYITDLTSSVEELEKIDKICRIIEISDELSNNLFSRLDQKEESDEHSNNNNKEWSVQKLCDKIKLEEFCTNVFHT